MILLMPVGIPDSIVSSSVDVVLHTFVPRDFVSSNSVKELVFLAYREAVGVNPSTPDSMEGFVEVFLIVLTALDQGDVG